MSGDIQLNLSSTWFFPALTLCSRPWGRSIGPMFEQRSGQDLRIMLNELCLYAGEKMNNESTMNQNC